MSKDEFKLSRTMYSSIEKMSDEQLGILFRAIYRFQVGLDSDIPSELVPIWAMFESKMIADIEKSRLISERNSANARKGGGNPSFRKGSPNPYYINEDKRHINEDKPPFMIDGPIDKRSLMIEGFNNKRSLMGQNINEDKRSLAVADRSGSSIDNIYINNNTTISTNSTERIPYEKVKDMWNSICVSLPSITSLSDRRRKKIGTRFSEMSSNGNAIEIVEKVFHMIEESDFLKGNSPTKWKATFDWIFDNGTNWLKVYEGNYRNRNVTTKTSNTIDYNANSEW